MKTIRNFFPGIAAVALCGLSLAYATLPANGQLATGLSTHGSTNNTVVLSNFESGYSLNRSPFYADARTAIRDDGDPTPYEIDLSKTTGQYRNITLIMSDVVKVGRQYPISTAGSANSILVEYDENNPTGGTNMGFASGGYVIFDSIANGVYSFRIVNAQLGNPGEHCILNFTGDATDDSVQQPTPSPTTKPTATPTATPTTKPTAIPTATPTAKPTATPLPGRANIGGRVTSFAPNSSGQIVEIGLSNGQVSCFSDRVVTVRTGSDGSFTLPNVVAGEYTVVAHTLSGNFSPLARRVVVAGRDVTGINFNTLAVGGKVTTGGRGVAGVKVTIAGREAVTTNAQGQWYYAGCQPGTFALSFEKAGNSFPTDKTVVLSKGAKYASIDVSATVGGAKYFDAPLSDSGPSGGSS